MARRREQQVVEPPKTRDLLEHLRERYEQYCNTGRVRIGNQDLEQDLGEREQTLEGFFGFSRRYLAVNRISSSGYPTGRLGVTLSDSLHYPIADVQMPATTDWNGAISVSSTAGQFDLPPAHSVPISKGS